MIFPKSRRTVLVGLVGLIALNLTSQVWLFANYSLPARDTVRFISIAQRFASEPARHVIQSEQDHPLYPLTLLGAKWLLQRLVENQSTAWLAAGFAVSILVGLVQIPLVFFWVRELAGNANAIWATVVYTILPLRLRESSDLLSDGLHLCLFTAGLYLVTRGFRRMSLTAFGLGGFLAAVAFWARPEALLLPLAATASLVVVWCAVKLQIAWPPRSWEPQKPLCAIVAVAAGALIPVTGFIWINGGKISNEKALHQMAGLPYKPSPNRQSETAPVAGEKRLHRRTRAERRLPSATATNPSRHTAAKTNQKGSGRKSSPVASARRTTSRARRGSLARLPALEAAEPTGHLSAAAAVFSKFFAGTFYLFGLAGLLGCWMGKRQFQPETSFCLLFMFVALCLILVHLGATVGYVSSRHTLLLLLFFSPWMGSGLREVARIAGMLFARISRQRRAQPRLANNSSTNASRQPNGPRSAWESGASGRYVFYLMIPLVLLCLGKALKPLHTERVARAHAIQWVANNTSSADGLLDVRGIISFSAGHQWYAMEQYDSALADPKLRYLVIETGDLRQRRRNLGRVRKLVRQCGDPLAVFGESDTTQVRIYQIPRRLLPATSIVRGNKTRGN